MADQPLDPIIFCTACGSLEKNGRCPNPNCPAKG